jgi:endonuclease YncB( thermonuclease family)
MKKAALISLIATLILALFFFGFEKITGHASENPKNYTGLKENRIVTKIIDGDTLIVSGGETIRLLGMDTDERGYPCYSIAKKYLENLTLGKEVILERGEEDKDQYGRSLRYIFLDNKNINVLLVEQGFAVARLEGSNFHAEEIKQAEAYAIANKIGCKWENQ